MSVFLFSIFILSSFLFIYTWVVYPFFCIWLSKQRNSIFVPDAVNGDALLSKVSIILPVYNPGDRLSLKLNNLMSINYHADYEVLIVSDGSQDGFFEKCAQEYATNKKTKFFSLPSNKGKSAAQNFAVDKAQYEVLFFTDVDAELDENAMKLMVQELQTNQEIGAVGGNVVFVDSNNGHKQHAGFYWGVEQRLREAESNLGCLLSLVGSAFAVRKKDFRVLDEDTGDDFVLPMDIYLETRRPALFKKDALVYDHWPAKNVRKEIKVRRRITLRNMTALFRRKKLMNPINNPKVSFMLISHKLLRWFSPILIGLSLLSLSAYLLINGNYLSLIFIILFGSFVLLVTFLRFVGFFVPKTGFLTAFVLANYGMLLGVLSVFLRKKVFSYTN